MSDQPSGALTACGEQSIVELFPPAPAGTLMASCRHDQAMSTAQCGMNPPSKPTHCRVEARSVDGGMRWKNFTAVPSLPDTGCKGGVARWDARQALLFSNPDVSKSRTRRRGRGGLQFAT